MLLVIRCIAGFIAGIIGAFVGVIAMEFFSAVVHPVPEDFKGTQEEMSLHVEHYPHWVLAVGVLAWAASAFAGTWVAGRIGNRWSALCVSMLLVAAVIFNIAMLPYPLWFKMLMPLVMGVAVIAGERMS